MIDKKGLLCFDVDSVREFVTKQDMSGHEDEITQFNCIREEVNELNVAWIRAIHAEYHITTCTEMEIEEMADVLVTLLVFARLRGYLDALESAFEKKMKVNVMKPVRKEKGMKVGKE